MKERLLKPTEAARSANLHPTTIRGWCRSGVLKARQVNGRWLITESALNDLLGFSPKPAPVIALTDDEKAHAVELRARLQEVLAKKESKLSKPWEAPSSLFTRGGQR